MLLGLQLCDCASRLLFCFLTGLSFSCADDFFDGTKLKNLEFPMQWQLRLRISEPLKIVSVCTFMNAHELFSICRTSLDAGYVPRVSVTARENVLAGPKNVLGNNSFELLLPG